MTLNGVRVTNHVATPQAAPLMCASGTTMKSEESFTRSGACVTVSSAILTTTSPKTATQNQVGSVLWVSNLKQPSRTSTPVPTPDNPA